MKNNTSSHIYMIRRLIFFLASFVTLQFRNFISYSHVNSFPDSYATINKLLSQVKQQYCYSGQSKACSFLQNTKEKDLWRNMGARHTVIMKHRNISWPLTYQVCGVNKLIIRDQSSLNMTNFWLTLINNYVMINKSDSNKRILKLGQVNSFSYVGQLET